MCGGRQSALHKVQQFIFNYESLYSCVCFGFALLRSLIGSKNSHHFFNQSDAKLKPIVSWSHAFSRAWCWFMYLLRVLLLGFLCCFCLLWLARVITLVSVLLHSIENRRNLMLKLITGCFPLKATPVFVIWKRNFSSHNGDRGCSPGSSVVRCSDELQSCLKPLCLICHPMSLEKLQQLEERKKGDSGKTVCTLIYYKSFRRHSESIGLCQETSVVFAKSSLKHPKSFRLLLSNQRLAPVFRKLSRQLVAVGKPRAR